MQRCLTLLSAHPQLPGRVLDDCKGGACRQACKLQAVDVQIYHLLLEAALQAQQYEPKRLELTCAWQWLLTGFGETHITSLGTHRFRYADL